MSKLLSGKPGCQERVNISKDVEEKTEVSVVSKKQIDPACIGCPYGKHHEFCFPCMKKILGREDIPANA